MISPENDTEWLMKRISAEVAKRKAGQASAVHRIGAAALHEPPGESSVPVLAPLVLPTSYAPPAKPSFQSPDGRYLLRDLLRLEDRDFVQNAYLAVMHRPADASGLAAYLAHLRDGMPKIEILGLLRYSPEGRKAGARIPGLSRHYLWVLASRLRVVGPLVRWAHAVLGLAGAQRRRRQFEGWAFATHEAAQLRTEEAIALVNRALGDLERAFGELASFAASRASGAGMAARDAAVADLTESLTGDLSTHRAAFHAALQNLRQSVAASLESKAERAEVMAARDAAAAALDAALAPLRAAVAALADTAAETAAAATAAAEHAAAEHAAAEQAIRGAQALESLSAVKADREELEQVRREIDAAIEAALAADRRQFAALLDDKASRAELRGQVVMARSQFLMALDEVRESRAEKSALEIKVGHEELEKLRGELATSLTPLYQSVGALLTSKAERASVDSAMHDVRRTIDSLAAVKADRTEMAAMLTGPNFDALAAGLREEARLSQAAARQQTEVALQASLGPLQMRGVDLKRTVIDLERRVGLLLEEARKRLPAPFSTAQLESLAAEDDHQLDAFYASFEDRFRGTRSEVKERLRIYLPHVRDAKAGRARAPVIDLGCGRGEWLELLREDGLQARGVDINRVFLSACRDLNLDVVEQDALSHLRSLKAASVGAVTCFHLIEHLPLKTLIAMFDESLRVLKPGGLAIFESPNPGNLLVGSCNFYFDPTHRNPLPAPLTQSLLEIRGFSRLEVLYLHPYEAANLLVPGDQPVQHMINQFFFGPQDYAVVARKV